MLKSFIPKLKGSDKATTILSRVVTAMYIIACIALLGDMFPAWSSFFINFFNGSLFEPQVLSEVAKDVLEIHAIFLSLAFVLTVNAIINKQMSWTQFLVILVISSGLNLYEFLDNQVHPLFMQMGIFDSFIRPGMTGLNPQYTRLTLFLIAAIVLLGLVVYKKTRTMDRCFTLLIAGAVIVTSFLFHVVIPMGMLKYTRVDRLETFITDMTELPSDLFCKNRTCIFFDENFVEKKEMFVGSPHLISEFAGFISTSKDFFHNESNRVNPIYGNAGDFIGVKAVFHACIHQRKGQYMCAMDENAMKKYGILSQLYFSLLASIAHGFWIFGGLILLALHKSRKVHKFVHSKKN